MRRRRWTLAVWTLLTISGCAATVEQPRDPLLVARAAAESSNDSELLGRALLVELIAPGGATTKAGALRSRIDDQAQAKGAYSSLARALDDELHGSLNSASGYYLQALEALSSSDSAETALLASFASVRLRMLRGVTDSFFKTNQARMQALFNRPGRIGYRARTDLLTLLHSEKTTAASRAQFSTDGGCVTAARFAGPFGKPANGDIFVKFAAEEPTPWPTAFPPSRADGTSPIVRAGQAGECTLTAVGTPAANAAGAHYVESFITVDQEVAGLLSVSGALSIRVNGWEVAKYDPRNFASFASSVVALRLAPGRHRVVARLLSPSTELRFIDRWGVPVAFKADTDGALPHSLSKPTVEHNHHPLAPWLRAASLVEPGNWPAPPPSRTQVDVADPVLRYIASALSSSEGHHDLATVLLEPLVKEQARATAASLALAAFAAEEDPIFSKNDARDLAFLYRKEAVNKDARLWYAQLWLLIHTAEKEGEKTALEPLAELARNFPEVPAIGKALYSLYGRLGYKPEQKRVVADLARRFPADLEVLRSYVSSLEEDGKRDEARELALRIDELAGSRSFAFERAVGRGDWDLARGLLQLDLADAEDTAREELALRVEALEVRGGHKAETKSGLEKQLELDPTSVKKSMGLADFLLSRGDHTALRAALAQAHREGTDPSEVRDAIELVDGETDLSPFRIDGLAEIRAYEASGAALAGQQKTRGGTAARVLDYATLWVYRDGSARMLEHEILHMQSSEAIARHAEQQLPNGKLLRIRTVKADGSIHEPEIVSGKPTATMPHLAVGDYIETETLIDLPGDGRGERFISPRWFFREEGVDYQRSEFVVVTPRARELVIETTGDVPAPAVQENGQVTVRRFRVDKSPALPNEPFSAPASEFLPSVRFGWGIDEKTTLDRLRDATLDLEPEDPRLVRVARTIITESSKSEEQLELLAKIPPRERAKRLYRWVLENIEPANESDARRSIMARSGSPVRAFLYLARLMRIEAFPAVVEDKLGRPPVFPMEKAERFGALAVVLPKQGPNEEDTWLFPDGKYTPFGYLPGSLRGQPAVLLSDKLEKAVASGAGTVDGVKNTGSVKLRADGSATFALKQEFTGKLAIVLRNEIQKIPDVDRLKAALEAELLPQALPGARILSFEVKNLENLDEPFVLEFQLEIARFAAPSEAGLIVLPPFSANVQLASFFQLPRRETPLILPSGASLRTEVDVTIELPKGASVTMPLEPQSGDNAGISYRISDATSAGKLQFQRVVTIPALRVEPADYTNFANFARTLDDALHREILVKVP